MPTFNTTDPKPGYVYDSAVDTWYPLLGIAPASQVDRWTKTAAGGETSLSGNDDNAVSLAYTSGTEQVYLNGVLLVRGQDYTASNGTTITALTALTASDVAEVVTFNPSNIITTDAVLSTDFEAKGDIISASAASTPLRLPVGTNGQVLKANSATTSGLEWGSDSTYSAPTIGSTSIASGATVTTIAGLTLSAPLLASPEESANIIGSAPAATQTIDFVTSGVHYFTSNSTSNVTLNFRGDGSTTLNSLLPTGGTATFSVIFTNGSTPYIANAFQIDGSTVTPKWAGGTAPTAGNASSNDFYSFNILKTGNAAFTVFASGASKFA